MPNCHDIKIRRENDIHNVTDRKESCQKTLERHGVSCKRCTCECKRFILRCVSQTGDPINKCAPRGRISTRKLAERDRGSEINGVQGC